MRKTILLFSISTFCFLAKAQTVISVSSTTDLYISPGTLFSPGGISLAPSAGFNLKGMKLDKATTLVHPSLNKYVLNTLRFSGNTNPYSGTIQFYYKDAELNSLTKASLQVNVHNGSSWLAFTSAANDPIANNVLSSIITARTLSEIALASATSPLPLQWGSIAGRRTSQTIKIVWTTWQESNASHFSIERSEEGSRWQTVIDNLPATNSATAKEYAAIDTDYRSSRLYYRIRETDLDGRISYSPVTSVAAENETVHLQLYPNPAHTSFYIDMANGTIKQVALYNNAGAIVKTWVGTQAYYNIKELNAAVYHLQIELKDGSIQHLTFNKQ
ncbi:MAG: C-terminal target protein [Segetibacter sp.]|nr:C-terminal target protein [Segetibacter sp.]